MRLAFAYVGSRHNNTRRRGRDAVMQDFAKSFYLSKAWRDTRAYIFKRDMGLCVRCGKPGEIVHHKRYLTPQNIDNPSITLSEDNLELLCRECHAIEHEGQAPTAAGLMFDDKGNLVEREAVNAS
jgi:5-methylcytosine-specific restriction protein A